MSSSVLPGSVWISGVTRSGKTTRLVQHFCQWATMVVEDGLRPEMTQPARPLPGVLALAAIGDNRPELLDRLTRSTQGRYPVTATTPIGWFETEVTLFWPLLIQALNLKAEFPLRLAPETEQELASRLWQPDLDRAIGQANLNAPRLVRRVLDLVQLAAFAGLPLSDIPSRLQFGLEGGEAGWPFAETELAEMIQRWQTWCLERGLLTYGLLTDLYGQHLLSHPTYRRQLTQRYRLLLADDVDEYPAIARPLIEIFLHAAVPTVLTYNPEGSVRLGLGADPTYLADLADRCQVEDLPDGSGFGPDTATAVVELVTNPLFFATPPAGIQAIQTTSRAELLRRVGEVITERVQAHQLEPREIAVIAPGFDAIARYTLMEILSKQHIPVESLNDQRPLASYPVIRALLTLLTLVYPQLGRLVDRDAVAELLVVLSHPRSLGAMTAVEPTSPTIDPVRAGLLADCCFIPHPDQPRLLPATAFPRWDRLGYQTSTAYEQIREWITDQQQQLEQHLIPNVLLVLDRAIQKFLQGGSTLPFDQLSALRQLMDTAQHYWDVHDRLRRRDQADPAFALARFIQLLRSGTITANPYPVRPIGAASNAVTFANVFQYRSSRRSHRCHFWLDASSPRWLSGVDALFAAPLFLQRWNGQAWTAADQLHSHEQRLRRILLDLLGRSDSEVYLCHSDLATGGQEQTGVLLTLVNTVGT